MTRLQIGSITLAAASALAVGAWANAWFDKASASRQPLQLSVAPAELVADGYQTATVRIISASRPRVSISEERYTGAVAENRLATGMVTVDDLTETEKGVWQAPLHAGVKPGRVTVQASSPGSVAVSTVVRLDPYLNDRFGDGTPDALRLDQDSDKTAFRRWFTFLAETQYWNQNKTILPKEINDCAALIRYAYREALHGHDDGWAASANLPLVLGLPGIAKYQYPYTLLGPSLFRVKPGPLTASDLANDATAFAQFADANSLQRFNAHFLTRDLEKALPGDLLFFRHDPSGDNTRDAGMPFHTMMYLGKSQIHDDGQRYLLYHTGPSGSGSSTDPGEIRRPTVATLMQHPEPQWRPMSGNPTFLGVYRWNILR